MPKRSSLNRVFPSEYKNKDYVIIEPINKMKEYVVDNKRLERHLKYEQVLDKTQIHVLDDIDEDIKKHIDGQTDGNMNENLGHSYSLRKRFWWNRGK